VVDCRYGRAVRKIFDTAPSTLLPNNFCCGGTFSYVPRRSYFDHRSIDWLFVVVFDPPPPRRPSLICTSLASFAPPPLLAHLPSTPHASCHAVRARRRRHRQRRRCADDADDAAADVADKSHQGPQPPPCPTLHPISRLTQNSHRHTLPSPSLPPTTKRPTTIC